MFLMKDSCSRPSLFRVIIAMKSAHTFIDLLEKGIHADRALSSLPQCELRYVAKVPIGVYLAAKLFGWRFFPAPQLRRSATEKLRIHDATNNLDELTFWARSRPEWALATGALSGVFVLVVHGDEGRKSLLETCGDDWDWLFTLRTQAGVKRYIFYAWPENEQENPRSIHLGKGLSLLGEGDWLLFPPSREPGGVQHVFLTRSTPAQAPCWLRNLVFCAASAAAPSPANSLQHPYLVSRGMGATEEIV
jgi:hypothetical protein